MKKFLLTLALVVSIAGQSLAQIPTNWFSLPNLYANAYSCTSETARAQAAEALLVPQTTTLTINGQVWTMNSNGMFGVTGGSVSGVVWSVFGRTGVIAAATGDYTAAQVGAVATNDSRYLAARTNISLSGAVTVDQGGLGDYTNIAPAIAWVAAQHAVNPGSLYQIRVNDGVYNENLTFDGWTDLVGLGSYRAKIVGTTVVTNGGFMCANMYFSGNNYAGIIFSNVQNGVGCELLQSFFYCPSTVIGTNYVVRAVGCSAVQVEAHNCYFYEKNYSANASASSVLFEAHGNTGFDLQLLQCHLKESAANPNSEFLCWLTDNTDLEVYGCSWTTLHNNAPRIHLDGTSTMEWSGNFLNGSPNWTVLPTIEGSASSGFSTTPLWGNGSQLTGITAAQVGAVPTNDARYLATGTNILLNGTNYPAVAGTFALPAMTGPQGPQGNQGSSGTNGLNGTNGVVNGPYVASINGSTGTLSFVTNGLATTGGTMTGILALGPSYWFDTAGHILYGPGLRANIDYGNQILYGGGSSSVDYGNRTLGGIGGATNAGWNDFGFLGNGSQFTNISSAQVGAVATNDARYLAAISNGNSTAVTINNDLTVQDGLGHSITLSSGNGSIYAGGVSATTYAPPGNDTTMTEQIRSFGASSGQQTALDIHPVDNQSAAAGLDVVRISPRIISTGSGPNYLLNVGTNSDYYWAAGTHYSLFNVDLRGNTLVAGSLTASNGFFGSGSQLTGITAAQVGAASATTVNSIGSTQITVSAVQATNSAMASGNSAVKTLTTDTTNNLYICVSGQTYSPSAKYQCYSATGNVNLLVCTNWGVTYIANEVRANLYVAGAASVVLPSYFYNLGSSNYVSTITNLILLVKAPGCTNVGYSVWGIK